MSARQQAIHRERKEAWAGLTAGDTVLVKNKQFQQPVKAAAAFRRLARVELPLQVFGQRRVVAGGNLRLRVSNPGPGRREQRQHPRAAHVPRRL